MNLKEPTNFKLYYNSLTKDMEHSSIFDFYSSLDDAAEPLSWEPYLEVEKINPEQIIFKGEFQEIMPDGTTLPSKHYEATYEHLIEFHTKQNEHTPANFLSFSFCKLTLTDSNKLTLAVKNATRSFVGSPKTTTEAYNTFKRKALVVLNEISHDFSIGSLLGAGNHARVHVGVQCETGKRYAIKSLSKQKLLATAQNLKGLVNEIKILREISHPAIISLYEVYEEQDTVYLVLEHLKGGELFDKIVAKGNYSEADTAQVMKKLMHTIYYCHCRQILHRDLKPENILLVDTESDLDFKIVDFGLAIKLAAGKKETLRCGSPGYAAPEVLAKEGYDLKADIFSCGVILYVLLTGVAPFFAPTVEEIIEKNRKGIIEYPEELWKSVSKEARELVELMTLRDPSKRITAGQCLDHPWLAKGGLSKNVLQSAVANMKKYCAQAHDRFDVSRIKPDFGLLTSTPLMSKKEIPGGSLANIQLFKRISDIRTVTQRPEYLSAVKRQKFRKYSAQYGSQEHNYTSSPIISRDRGTSSVIIPVEKGSPTSAKLFEDDDSIPDEIEVIETRGRSCSISSSKPFSPGRDEARVLPPTPGADSTTKRTLDLSTFSTRAVLHPQSAILKKPSQFYNQQVEEGKQPSLSQTTLCTVNSSTPPPIISINNSASLKPVPTDVLLPNYGNEGTVKTSKTLDRDVDKVRRNLINAT